MVEKSYGCDVIPIYKATLRTEAPFEEMTLIRSKHLQKLLTLTSYSILYITVCSAEGHSTDSFVIKLVNSVSCVVIQQSVISKDMKVKLHMERTVNGHAFTIEGEEKFNLHE